MQMQSHGLRILTPNENTGRIMQALCSVAFSSVGSDTRMYYEQVLEHLVQAQLDVSSLYQIKLHFDTCPYPDLRQKFDALYVKLVPAPS